MKSNATIETFEHSGDHEAGRPVLVLLHGRGSHERDLIQLATPLGAASDGPEFTLVTPRAPWPGAPWNYGPGWAWYRYLGEDRPDIESFDASLGALDTFTESLPEVLGGPVGPLVLGGFSQGGTMSVAWGLTRPGQVAGAINLSGFLANVPLVRDHLDEGADLPVFWGHGHTDPAIPHDLAKEGRQALRDAGARVETFDHGGGHMITPEEIQSLGSWLASTLG